MIFDDYNNLKAQIGYKGESDSIFYHYNEKFELIKSVRVQFPSHERKLTNFKYYSNEGNQILSRTSTESSEISTVESNYFYTEDNILKEIRSNEIIFDFDDGANVSDMGKNYDDYDAWANIGASDGGSTWISFYDARGNIVESRYYCDPHSSFTKMKYDANELLTELNKDGYIQTFKYILDEKNNWVRRVTFSNSIATQFTIRKISYK